MKLVDFLNFLEKWPVSLLPLLVLLVIPWVTSKTPPSPAAEAITPEYSASLFLSPAEENLAVGQPFEVAVLLETGGAKVDGVDAILRYDPRMLEVVAIKKGNLFEEYIPEEIDKTRGRIRLSALTFDPRPKEGTLGTVVFRPLISGTATVFFEFTPGATRDSNVALSGAWGVDILKEVGNAHYVIR